MLQFPSVESLGEALVGNTSLWGPLLSLYTEADFNVSGMFMPPANCGLGEATLVEELSPEPPPTGTPTLLDGEV